MRQIKEGLKTQLHNRLTEIKSGRYHTVGPWARGRCVSEVQGNDRARSGSRVVASAFNNALLF